MKEAPRRPSRRGLLLGAAGAGAVGLVGVGVAVQQGVLPGRPELQDKLGLNGEPGRVPDAAPGRVVSGSFLSVARGGPDRLGGRAAPGSNR